MEINISITLTEDVTPEDLINLHNLIDTAYKAVSINNLQITFDMGD